MTALLILVVLCPLIVAGMTAWLDVPPYDEDDL